MSISYRISHAHENEYVHPLTLTGEAASLIQAKLKDPYNELFAAQKDGGYLIRGTLTDDNSIESGSMREDRILQGTLPFTHWDKYDEVPAFSMKCHFYNPWDGNGIDLCPNTVEYQKNPTFYPGFIWQKPGLFDYATKLYSTDKEHAYFTLGRVCHLLQDMSSPSHVEADNHFMPWVDNSENNYEQWCKDHATEIESYIT
jgi:hypothetical protein